MRQRLEERPVSAAFELAVIEQAILFLQLHLQDSGAGGDPHEACEEALEAIAALRARRA